MGALILKSYERHEVHVSETLMDRSYLSIVNVWVSDKQDILQTKIKVWPLVYFEDYIEDITLVVISYEIYPTSLRRV